MPTAVPQSINFYKGKFQLKEEIEKLNLKNVDEALNICDLTTVVSKFYTWKKHMPNVTPYYAVKCNDDPYIIKTLADLGASFDCASKNEIKLVLGLGVSPDRIIFANPMKATSHIEYMKAKNVTDSTVDNEFELYKIYKSFGDSNVVLRFLSEAENALCPLGDKFGCDAVEDAAAVLLLAESLNMNVTGVSFHVGSGCSDYPAYERAICTGSQLFKFGRLIGHYMKLLDIGGGFPGDNDDMFSNIAKVVNNSVDKYFKGIDVRVIGEPGRYFVAAAYTLVCKIYSKREIRQKDGKLEKVMYFINDGAYGTFNCLLYDHITIKVIHFENDGTETFKSLIWGPTCDALDKICDNLYLPNLREGDFIAFPNMGAYTVPTASPFNGFSVPKTRYFLRSDFL
ncbi:ornithine decarboxylase 1-like [Episyrphus balteatus]|uniref:ornithine decarboxylase 1-like n=1 Tax=Episyrphus balteatus TaxID=286459 RepID=UPI0024856B23|nr:ornithine decarboxylase 1-like [Episyrphus balteatus]